jgi:peptidoglycan/LPS O-acetylase OafA/YrhL
MKNQRSLSLDLARAIAMLLVFSNHLITNILKLDIGPFWYVAYLGVDIFFGLSGFLIGGILVRMCNNSNAVLTPSNTLIFLVRRWLRTAPMYFILLSINYFVCRYLLKNVSSFDWHYLLWLQNFAKQPSSFFGESWSLCIEEWFYLTYSITLCLFTVLAKRWKRSPITKVAIFTLGYILFFTIIRICFSASDRSEFHIALFRLDSIAYGVLLAAIGQHRRLKFYRHTVALVGVISLFSGILLFLLNSRLPFFFVFYYNLAGLGIACCIWYFQNSFTLTNISFKKAIVVCSKISYSIYLLNLLIIYILISLFSSLVNGFLLTIVALGLILTLSYVAYQYIECPVIALRDRFFRGERASETKLSFRR